MRSARRVRDGRAHPRDPARRAGAPHRPGHCPRPGSAEPLVMRIAVAAGLLASALLASLGASPDDPQGITVRYAEGVVHGFLELTDSAGASIADGELLQVHHGEYIESRMRFRFRDSSFFEET